MKITFILPVVSFAGGIRVVGIYAKTLAEMGHNVALVSLPPKNIPIRRKIMAFIRGQGWPRYNRINRSHLDGIGLDHRVLDCWRPVTDADVPDADIVIATWWETAEWVFALSDSKGSKVYFIQGHEVYEPIPKERSSATYRLPLYRIVVSKWLQNIMRTEYGVEQTDLVHNSVDHSQFFSLPRGKQPVPTVGFLFSNTKNKGAEIAMKVVSNLRVAFPNLRVIAFGTTMPPKGAIDNLVEFYCAPPQDKIKNIYAQCDVWLSVSRSEGFNLPAMEAMACRTPVISTKVGWPEEAIKTGENGVLVDVDDINALTQGALSILSLSDSAWREMSNNAYNTVASSTWQESVYQFEKALERARHRDKGLVVFGH